jgi:hypothetical protein
MRRTTPKLLTAIAAGLAAAALVPIASAGSAPQGKVAIPSWMARIQYPGTSSMPTVYLDPFGNRDGRPTTVVGPAGRVTIPASLTRINYPGTYPGASVVFPRVSATATPLAASASGFDWAAFGIGIAAALGMTLMGASALLAVRRRRTPAHV